MRGLEPAHTRAMPLPQVVITGFRSTRPRFALPQDDCLVWRATAHADGEALAGGLDDAARTRFEFRIAGAIRRVACPREKIGTRGHVAPLEATLGKGSAARTRLFADVVDAYFADEYAGDDVGPDDLVHVTCTGYASPSGAQKLVAARGWGNATRVTHAYHMGCYAAVPALRIGAGYLATGSEHVDVVHTELCSLHFHPDDHSLEQLVVQSLFGDGLIRYRLAHDTRAHGLRVVALHERVLPDSAQSMTWIVADAGMQMTLARDVPDRVSAAVRGFVLELFERGCRHVAELKHAMCAVHPGGPKIIDSVQEMLERDDAQVATSRAVLFEHGNMSSATLPPVW